MSSLLYWWPLLYIPGIIIRDLGHAFIILENVQISEVNLTTAVRDMTVATSSEVSTDLLTSISCHYGRRLKETNFTRKLSNSFDTLNITKLAVNQVVILYNFWQSSVSQSLIETGLQQDNPSPGLYKKNWQFHAPVTQTLLTKTNNLSASNRGRSWSSVKTLFKAHNRKN